MHVHISLVNESTSWASQTLQTSDIANIMCEQEINILTKFCIFVNIVVKHFRC